LYFLIYKGWENNGFGLLKECIGIGEVLVCGVGMVGVGLFVWLKGLG
jgi:hypothetical protein